MIKEELNKLCKTLLAIADDCRDYMLSFLKGTTMAQKFTIQPRSPHNDY